jgi:hypothetical protein
MVEVKVTPDPWKAVKAQAPRDSMKQRWHLTAATLLLRTILVQQHAPHCGGDLIGVEGPN